MLFYALTIFLSAFLLFEVQPLIAKLILPWFGGSAAVWTTSLMFFQVTLLAGYLYAYCTIKWLKPRAQAVLHVGLLTATILVLPIVPSPSWKPDVTTDPTGRIVLLLAVTVGAPYLLLSTTGPLLQAWYARTEHASFPYRLYALSNLGSMTALLAYPVLIEPLLTGYRQAIYWSFGYTGFAAVCAWTAWRSRSGRNEQSIEHERPRTPSPTWDALLFWILLAAAPSILLLAVTSHLSQNVAPIPFLWVLPLSIYLLSFILCFESERTYRREIFLPLLLLSLGAMSWALYYNGGNADVKLAVPLFALGLFVCCMVCHGELARRKPDVDHLTAFYVMVSIGGAVGGLFVALVAPNIFTSYAELPIGFVLTGTLAGYCFWTDPLVEGGSISPSTLGLVVLSLTAGIAGYLVREHQTYERQFLLTARNFYGVLRVREQAEGTESNALRTLYHGTISHGEQLTNADLRRTPTSYYSENSGVGIAVQRLHELPVNRVAIIGLGAGVMASWSRYGDEYHFYEINPLVYDISKRYFTFLPDCPARQEIRLGDARLVLEQQPPQSYDLLAVDAFSGDSIPVHLLTREAFDLYFRHLKPTGVLAVHISNRYLDLEPVVARLASEMRKQAIVVDNEEDADYLSSATWILIGNHLPDYKNRATKDVEIRSVRLRARAPLWTDDYSNLFGVLK